MPCHAFLLRQVEHKRRRLLPLHAHSHFGSSASPARERPARPGAFSLFGAACAAVRWLRALCEGRGRNADNDRAQSFAGFSKEPYEDLDLDGSFYANLRRRP